MEKENNISTSNANLPLGWENPDAVYFLGIGGIGMSALARYYNSRGTHVSGYDKTPTALTDQLQSEGIAVHFEDDVDVINKKANFVVYTPAIPNEHSELNYFITHHYPVFKRSEVLGMITKSNVNICVAGTHGKSTTSAMTAHILRDSGFGCNAFLGAISANYQTNFWSSPNPVCVAEADEYDRSFLKLSPDVAIITSMDPDHLDIYGTAENMEDAFVAFSQRVKPNGCLISKFGLKRSDAFTVTNRISYAVNNPLADAHATNIIQVGGGYRFDLILKHQTINNIDLPMGGLHNIENIVAAILAALQLQIPVQDIVKAVGNFAGVKRRFEYVYQDEQRLYIDDYAHHPEELRALINGAKTLFPEKKCCIIFQPHLFSRTYDFATEFAEVLSMADETVLLPIYPAREKPVEGVSSKLILDKLSNRQHQILDKSEILEWLRSKDIDMLITAGAGDIDKLVNPIKAFLQQKN